MEGNAAKANLPFHLPVFLMGYYLFMKYKGKISEREFWIGIAVCAFVCAYLTGVLHALGFRIVITALSTTLLIRFTRNGWAWMGKIGEVSYSIYLMHWPIISALCFLLGGILKTPWGNATVFGCIQIAAVIFAFLFYRIIEKPALKWAKAVRYRRSE
jgi:peptidoglycan/LPS O-acetylase OafA/YrhL